MSGFMNTTDLIISKEQAKKLSILSEDDSGYWVHTREGFQIGTGNIHQGIYETKEELMQALNTLTDCDCEECSLETVPMTF